MSCLWSEQCHIRILFHNTLCQNIFCHILVRTVRFSVRAVKYFQFFLSEQFIFLSHIYSPFFLSHIVVTVRTVHFSVTTVHFYVTSHVFPIFFCQNSSFFCHNSQVAISNFFCHFFCHTFPFFSVRTVHFSVTYVFPYFPVRTVHFSVTYFLDHFFVTQSHNISVRTVRFSVTKSVFSCQNSSFFPSHISIFSVRTVHFFCNHVQSHILCFCQSHYIRTYINIRYTYPGPYNKLSYAGST